MKHIKILSLLLAFALIFSACAPVAEPIMPSSSTLSSAPGTSSVPSSSVPATSAPATSVPDTTPPASSVPETQPSTSEPPATQPNTPPETQPPVVTHSCPQEDPYTNVNKTAFYANYTPACCLINSQYRTQHGLLSGINEVPGQHAVEAENRPMENKQYLRNTSTYYLDGGSTYVVVDSTGREVLRVYKGGAYITLEEVAAYLYAFGGGKDDMPANYTVSKKTSPSSSIWGEYLRVNHSQFSGSTSKYPYEPQLPDISGCGGDLIYYELDIGTTGTVTSPEYPPALYNDGYTITRGAARIVHCRQDKNRNGIYEPNEVYVFYTDNHYNDFREYLNYYGGWGEIFGNITGGGELSSKYNYNPTPYVPTGYKEFVTVNQAA